MTTHEDRVRAYLFNVLGEQRREIYGNCGNAVLCAVHVVVCIALTRRNLVGSEFDKSTARRQIGADQYAPAHWNRSQMHDAPYHCIP